MKVSRQCLGGSEVSSHAKLVLYHVDSFSPCLPLVLDKTLPSDFRESPGLMAALPAPRMQNAVKLSPLSKLQIGHGCSRMYSVAQGVVHAIHVHILFCLPYHDTSRSFFGSRRTNCLACQCSLKHGLILLCPFHTLRYTREISRRPRNGSCRRLSS